MTQRVIALSVIVAADAFGQRVIDAIEELVPSLPPVYKLGVRTVPAGKMGEWADVRQALIGLDNTESIQKLGYAALGSNEGNINVQIYLIGEIGDDSAVPETIRSLSDEHPEDVLCYIAMAPDDSAATKSLLRRVCNSVAIPFLVTCNAGGHALNSDAVVGGMAGFVFTQISRAESRYSYPDNDSVYTIGFAGKIGLAEAAKYQLAKHTELRLCRLQRKPEEHAIGAESRHKLDAWQQRYSPARLAVDLFSAEIAGVSEHARIPAVVTWVPGEVADSLVVQLDRAAVALAIDDSRPLGWAAELRRFSRAFDMTQGVRWNRLLAQAAGRLQHMVQEEMLGGFRAALGATVHPVKLCGEVLSVLRESLEHRVVAEATPDSDLDEALRDLELTAERQLSLLSLILRMALWIVPAIVVGTGLFDLFYDGVRGILFSVLYALVLASAGVVWPWLNVSRARAELQRARDTAIDIMVTRQEGIVAENAVGYLQEVQSEVGVVLGDIDTHYQTYVEHLDAWIEQLQLAVEAELPSPLTLEPVITRFEEFDKAYRLLGIDSPEWLEKSVGAGYFGCEGSSKTEWVFSQNKKLVEWCFKRISDSSSVHLPDFQSLWSIRENVRGDTSLEGAISEVWRRAAPFCNGAPRGETSLILCTPDILDRTTTHTADSNDFRQVTVELLQDAQILACLRFGSLGSE